MPYNFGNASIGKFHTVITFMNLEWMVTAPDSFLDHDKRITCQGLPHQVYKVRYGSLRPAWYSLDETGVVIPCFAN